MKLKRLLWFCSLVIMICWSCISCISTSYPKRTQYMLNINTKALKPIYKTTPTKILLINNVTIVPQFAGISFVYRLSDIHYTKDYYHIFFNAPAQQIEELMVKYLQTTHLFNYVSDDVNLATPTYSLQARIIELYADYRNSNNPKGVITIRFTLLHSGKKRQLLLHRTFSEAIPLQAKDSISLVEAWNTGLVKILAQLTNNLKNV